MTLTKVNNRMIDGASVNVKDFGAVGDGVTNDTVAVQAADTAAEALGALLVFPAGTYYLVGDYSFKSCVEMRGGSIYSGDFMSFPNGFDAAPYWCLKTRVRKMTGRRNVRWWGARGDNTGATPSDDSINIASDLWNTWDGLAFKTDLAWSPYGISGSFVAPNATPFTNNDTWDYIGISMALWSAEDEYSCTYIPAGRYQINMNVTSRGAYRGLLVMKDMEQAIVGDGSYETYIGPKEDAAFFDTNNTGVATYYSLLSLYRIGGPPTNIRDISFSGPLGYTVPSANLTLIWCQNINGVTFRDIWLAGAWDGIRADISCSDSHIKGTTSEFLFGATVRTDATSDFSIDFCNFWASAAVPNQSGVIAAGSVQITNTRFVEFRGLAVSSASGYMCNCLVISESLGAAVEFSNSCHIVGNKISGNSNSALIKIVKDASIVGNWFQQGNPQPCIDAGDNSNASATNIVISGNTFIKTDLTVAPQNYTITANETAVSFTGAATASLFVIGNTFQGPSLTTIGSATLKDNIFNGVYTA